MKVIDVVLMMLQLYKIVQLCIFTTFLEFTLSETFSNPTKDLQKWCEVPNVQNTFNGLRLQGSSELNVRIRQFPFMASYGYLKGIYFYPHTQFLNTYTANISAVPSTVNCGAMFPTLVWQYSELLMAMIVQPGTK